MNNEQVWDSHDEPLPGRGITSQRLVHCHTLIVENHRSLKLISSLENLTIFVIHIQWRVESKFSWYQPGTVYLEIWTDWNFGLTSIAFPHVNYKQVLSASVSRNTDNNHHNCYLTTNYEAEGD